MYNVQLKYHVSWGSGNKTEIRSFITDAKPRVDVVGNWYNIMRWLLVQYYQMATASPFTIRAVVMGAKSSVVMGVKSSAETGNSDGKGRVMFQLSFSP